MTSKVSQKTLQINGVDLALKIHNEEAGSMPVLALHGWLDNAASFDKLAPLLDPKIQLISLDLPGHGQSSHRAEGAEYYIWSYVEDVIAVADALGLEQFSLLGHSMGGSVSCFVSSLYPNRVKKMALLDVMGPTTSSPAEAVKQMRKALKQKFSGKDKVRHYYTSRELALKARANKGLTMESSILLGERALTETEKGFYWTNDRRLNRLNLMSMTQDHVKAFFKEITCPTRLVASSQQESELFEKHRKRLLDIATENNFEVTFLPGNHHQHLEGQVEEVASLLNQFF